MVEIETTFTDGFAAVRSCTSTSCSTLRRPVTTKRSWSGLNPQLARSVTKVSTSESSATRRTVNVTAGNDPVAVTR